jgi:hypothetical protein
MYNTVLLGTGPSPRRIFKGPSFFAFFSGSVFDSATRHNYVPKIEGLILYEGKNKKIVMAIRISPLACGTLKCIGPHHDLDDFTRLYDLTTFTTSRLVI